MAHLPRINPRSFSLFIRLSSITALAVFAAALISCSGSGSGTMMSSGGMGTINVSITDPPRCRFPNGAFDHVFVTISSVRAHVNAGASEGTPGWQELVPQLNDQPMQIDLFASASTACLLTTLGSNTALPAGNYQQIRLILLANDGGSGPLPVSNACGNQGFNCVVLQDGSVQELLLSSESHTGLKILPGIMVAAGQDVDLNIDFDACSSIHREGNGKFRLKPVLRVSEVGTNHTGISGQAVDSVTGAPIAGGTVLVALEQPDNSGADVIFLETAADALGDFNFCPLPGGMTFDVVVVAINGAGVAYNATVAVGVADGTALSAIPLFAETGVATGPATLQGFVTATTSMTPATIDATISALQTITLVGGVNRLVTIPSEGNSTLNISVESNSSCPATAPMNTNCAPYTLIEPASNPSVGTFSGGNISYAPPASGDVLYTVRADASDASGANDCLQPSKTTSMDANGNPLKVSPGATVTTKEIDFTGCT
jgi:hypothetical protein